MGTQRYSTQRIQEAVADSLEHFKALLATRDESFEEAFADTEHYFVLGLEASRPRGMAVPDSIQSAMEAWESARKELQERCYKIHLDHQKEKKVQSIHSSLFEALVLPHITELGLPYHIEFQKLRMKISLLVDCRKAFTFYIRYKDFQNENVLEKVPEVLRMIPILKDFGPQITLLSKDRIDGVWTWPERG